MLGREERAKIQLDLKRFIMILENPMNKENDSLSLFRG